MLTKCICQGDKKSWHYFSQISFILTGGHTVTVNFVYSYHKGSTYRVDLFTCLLFGIFPCNILERFLYLRKCSCLLFFKLKKKKWFARLREPFLITGSLTRKTDGLKYQSVVKPQWDSKKRVLVHFVPANELKITAPTHVGRRLICPLGRADRK